MIFILFLFAILYLLGLLLFEKPVLLQIETDTAQNVFSLNFTWLFPFLAVNVKAIDYHPVVSLYLFRKKILAKPVKRGPKGKRNRIHYLQNIYFYDSNIEAFYGFNNPFSTGIANGLLFMVQTLFPNMPLYAVPDFIADHNYIILKGNAKINLGKTLLRFFHHKNKNRSERYGTVKYQ